MPGISIRSEQLFPPKSMMDPNDLANTHTPSANVGEILQSIMLWKSIQKTVSIDVVVKRDVVIVTITASESEAFPEMYRHHVTYNQIAFWTTYAKEVSNISLFFNLI